MTLTLALTLALTLTRLSADPHAQLADGRKECSAAQNGSTFKLDLYRSYEKHRRAQQTLLGGQAVRLIHKEAEGYIGSDHRRAQLGLPVYVQNAEVVHKHVDPNPKPKPNPKPRPNRTITLALTLTLS